MTNVAPIRPELLAAKLEEIENFEQPHLVDELIARPELPRLLCYLQHVSQPRHYAGGLTKFAAELIADSAAFIGSVAMRAELRAGERFELSDAVAVFASFTEDARYELFGSNCELFEEAFLHGLHDRVVTLGESRRDWVPQFLDTLTPARALAVCTAEARSHLAEYLKAVCEQSHIGLLSASREAYQGAPWYFERIADALAVFIESRATSQRAALAVTAVTKSVTTWVAKSRRMKTAVMIIGNSRFGKTEAVQMEAATRPGDCRLVHTPPGNALSDLLREVAKSIGIEVGPQINVRALGEKIDYTLRFLRLQLIVDEFQFCLPSTYSRNTAPARLNWFRRSIMDQQIPTVLVCTPQSYLPAKRRFVKATGFAIEQFEERIDKTVNLPDELDDADLLAAARVHFPDLSEDYLRFVVAKTAATERNYISDIAKIARHANDHAQEHGRKRPILADINAAIADVLPMTVAPKLAPPPQKRPRKTSAGDRPATPVQPARKSAAASLQERSTRPAVASISSREIQPLLSG